MNDDRQCVWACTESADAPTIQWSGLQSMLEHAESDVLILLDCCAAASSVSGVSASRSSVHIVANSLTWIRRAPV